MKKTINLCIAFAIFAFVLASCSSNTNTSNKETNASQTSSQPIQGQSAVVDDQSANDIVKVAASSKDHTTLVAAIKAVNYLDVLSNAGPFTVFAPTNAAFDALPAGTLDNLLKPENSDQLIDILEYHVTTSSLKIESFKDGQNVGMVNGGNAKMTVKDNKVQINGANIITSIPATNGMIHVIDAVLLPPNQ